MIEIAELAGVATIQDGGRPGHMHEGVPAGGALVPQLLARANAAAHNAPGEAAIELVGRMVLVARAPVRVATDDGEARSLARDEAWTIRAGAVDGAAASAASAARVRYVALRGGIDVPLVLGARATLLVAHLGGLGGRALRRGDRLPCGKGPPLEYPLPPPLDAGAPLRVVLGPDLDRFSADAAEVLLRSTYVVDARSDRVGVRLAGPCLPRAGEDLGVSAPMVRGAIQVPSSGQPIVLGPDHPTLGGYPVLATVVRDDVGALAARPVGSALRFVAT